MKGLEKPAGLIEYAYPLKNGFQNPLADLAVDR